MKRPLRRVLLTGALVLALLPALSGCDITALNDNPNEPSEASLPALLTNALTDYASLKYDDFYSGRFGMLYAQYWSQTQYINESRYQYPIVRAGAVGDQWNNYYLTLNELQQIINANRERAEEVSVYGPNANQIAIAKIMQVYIYQMMTDIWGPIPFTDALGGATGNFTPTYASQEEVYMGILDSLNAAIGMIDTDFAALASGDVVFGGDMSKWLAFANSLKMRIAIRIAEAAPGTAESAFVEAYQATTIDEVEGGLPVLIPFQDNPTYWNPLYGNWLDGGGRDDWAMSRTLIHFMNEWKDPRRAAYATTSPGDDYTGFPYGLTQGPATAYWAGGSGDFSRPGDPAAYDPVSPAILMLPDEVLFNKAEAAARGWIAADPAGLYEEAITASMHYWLEVAPPIVGMEPMYDQAAVDAYIANVPYEADNWRQSIGVQKWIAFYMQGVQGWSVFRRLDFEGVLVAPPGNPGQGTFGQWFPTRLLYPNDEATLNNQNYEEAVNMLGEDSQGAALWWDGSTLPEPAPRRD